MKQNSSWRHAHSGLVGQPSSGKLLGFRVELQARRGALE